MKAFAKRESLAEPPAISSLARFEFEPAVWLNAQRQPLGMSEAAAQSVLAVFAWYLEQDVWRVATLDWEEVVSRAEKLAIDHTPRRGAKAMYVRRVATVLQLGAAELPSFDAN